MIKTIAPQRTDDPWGSGAWHASRGDRLHTGVDYACWPGSQVLSGTVGVVSKVGWPYSPEHEKKGHLRYVEIHTPLGYDIRYMYIDPTVKQGDKISKNQVIGIAQDLTKIYPGITPHVHVDVRKLSEYINPEIYFGEIS